MARIRTIKPEFFTSPDMAELDVLGRLTYIGLWTHVDDQGICLDDARLIHAALYPLDESVTVADIDDVLDAFAAADLVWRYRNGSRSYLQVKAWHHQLINRPSKPKLPAHDHPGSTLTEGSVSVHGGLTEGSLPDQGTGKGTEQGTDPCAEPASQALTLVDVTTTPAAPARKQRDPDPLYEAVIAACGLDYSEMTAGARKSTGVAVAELRGVNAAPNEIAARAAAYKRKFPQAALTPSALAKHWAGLRLDQQAVGGPQMSKSMQALESVGRRLGVIEGGSR